MITYETMNGKITISYEYLSKLIGNAVTSCYGVVGMVPSNTKQRFFNTFTRKKPLSQGIDVQGGSNSLNIDIHIVVTYGMNINAIAQSIVQKVKYVVKEATEIEVRKVTVKVDGIKE